MPPVSDTDAVCAEHDACYDESFTREEEELCDLECLRDLEHVVADDLYEELYRRGAMHVFQHDRSLANTTQCERHLGWGYPRSSARSQKTNLTDGKGKGNGSKGPTRRQRRAARQAAVERTLAVLRRAPSGAKRPGPKRKKQRRKNILRDKQVVGADAYRGPNYNLNKWGWKENGKGGVVITGDEYIGPITATSANVTGDILLQQTLNPLTITSSRIAEIAALWTRYKYRECVFTYEPAVGFTTNGQIAMYIDRDVEDNYATSPGTGSISQYKAIVNHMDCKESSVLKKFSTFLRPSGDLTSYFVAPDSTNEQRLSEQGKFWVALGLNPPASGSVSFGAVYMRFAIELWEPAFNVNFGLSAPVTSEMTWTWSSLPKSSNNMCGDTQLWQVNDLSCYWTGNSNVLTFNAVSGAKYLLAVWVTAPTFSATTGSGMTYSTMQGLGFVINPISYYSGSTGGFWYVVMLEAVVTGNVLFDFQAANALPIASGANSQPNRLILTQIDATAVLSCLYKHHAKTICKIAKKNGMDVKFSLINPLAIPHPIEEPKKELGDRLEEMFERLLARPVVEEHKRVESRVFKGEGPVLYIPPPEKATVYEAKAEPVVETAKSHIESDSDSEHEWTSSSEADDDVALSFFRSEKCNMKWICGWSVLSEKEQDSLRHIHASLRCYCGKQKCDICGSRSLKQVGETPLMPLTRIPNPEDREFHDAFWKRVMECGHIPRHILDDSGLVRSLTAWLWRHAKRARRHIESQTRESESATPLGGGGPVKVEVRNDKSPVKGA